jgi:hypothetical protein
MTFESMPPNWTRQGTVAHPANADEAQFPNGIANFTKGLPHDQFGETDVATYQNY